MRTLFRDPYIVGAVIGAAAVVILEGLAATMLQAWNDYNRQACMATAWQAARDTKDIEAADRVLRTCYFERAVR